MVHCAAARHRLSCCGAKQKDAVPDAGMLLVDTELQSLRRPAALADFLHLHELHIGDVTDALKSDWILKVSCAVRVVAAMQHSLQVAMSG